MWLLYAFSGPLLWAVSTHIDKYLVDKYFRDADTNVLILFTALIGAALLPVIYVVQPHVLSPAPGPIAVMMFSGALYISAILFYLRAIQSEEASVVAPLFQASTLFTFMLGYIFLHESLKPGQIFGGALILIGALGLSLNNGMNFKGFNVRVVVLMLGCTFVLAVSSVMFKYFAIRDDFWTVTFWTFVGQAFVGLAFFARPAYRRQFADLFRANPGAVIGINAANELVNLGAGLGVRYASMLAPVALVSAISSTTTFFVFSFGILLTLFFPKLGREDMSARNLVRKAVGATLIAGGVILIESGGI